MSLGSMSMKHLIILCFVAAVHGARERDPLKEAIRFCESYVQCKAVTTLEERLCLGNSYERPHWLPNLDFDSFNCHQLLRNDYILLERMEEKLDDLLTDCLIKNTSPFTAQKLLQCNEHVIRGATIFSFGHSIHYIPTNCFNGLNIRRRQCDEVRMCCPALLQCSTISTESQLAKSIEQVKQNMIRRAKECQNGTEIEKLQLPQVCLDDTQSNLQVSQHVTENIGETTVATVVEEPKGETGNEVDVSSGEGSGYEASPSGYVAGQTGPDGKETTLTSTLQTAPTSTLQFDTNGSGHDDGSGTISEGNSLALNGNNENIPSDFEARSGDSENVPSDFEVRNGNNENMPSESESTTPPLVFLL